MSDPARTPDLMDNTTNIRTAWRSAGFCSMQWFERPVNNLQTIENKCDLAIDVRARQ